MRQRKDYDSFLGLIVGRILYLGRAPGISRYRGILEIFIESAALYSLIMIIYIPFFADTTVITGSRYYYLKSLVVPITVRHHNKTHGHELTCPSTWQGIAPTLIIARVALGQSRSDGGWTRTDSYATSPVEFRRPDLDTSNSSRTKFGTLEHDPEKSLGSDAVVDVRYTQTVRQT